MIKFIHFKNVHYTVVKIQSFLCEVACEENSRGLKIAVAKI